MRRLASTVLLSFASLLALPAGTTLCQEAAKQPFELVRSLRALQDRIAQGDTAAHAAQRKLVAEIAEEMVAANATVWSDPRNARAAIIYALSGGEPRVLKPLFRVRALPGIDDKLLNGALAYSEGRNAEAAELLANIDPRALDPSLGGHVALVRSTLVAGKDAAKAIPLLDDARLLAPGTLVEEAALRRQTFLVAVAGDRDGFEMLASQYMRRFPNSVYAGSFREQYAMEITGERYAAERLPRLEATLRELEAPSRHQFYLAIAREAVIKGRAELASLAAGNAVRLGEEEGADTVRARLYAAAAAVVGDDMEQGRSSLESVERSKLEPRDAELADAVLAIASEVVRPVPDVAVAGDAPPPAAAGAKPRDEERLAATLGTIKTVRQALAQVDSILAEVAK